MKTEQILLLFILILLAACTAFAWGFAHYKKRWFSLYQNVQNFQKTLLEDGQIPAASPGEDAENIIRDGFVRIEKKYGREREAALRDKDAIQSLILDLSHQLKTPLANIQLYQELLRAPDLPPDKKKQLEDRLEEQTDKLDWLLGSLFKMADLERGTAALNASYTSVIPTVRKAVESILLKADQKKIRIEMSPFSDAPLFHDSAWTEEVFVNLLENAVKYAPEETTIHLSMECYETYGSVCIRDEGPGIPKEEYSRIFQKFYRGSSSAGKEGWGIGLYLSRLILEKERVYITVDSSVGEGSCFTVFLPVMTKR